MELFKKNKSICKSEWHIEVSPQAALTVNLIRSIVESLDLKPNPDLQMIPLSIGDPTTFGNLLPSSVAIDAIKESLDSYRCNGYFPSTGSEEARQAVAEHCSVAGAELEAKDVILTSGCSHALDLAMTALAARGTNILVPRPGFPLYQTLASQIGVEIRFYNLLADQNWEIDLDDLQDQIDGKTVAIIYNNPSNPCGSVYSRRHIEDFLSIAERHHIPIIADEIYDELVFEEGLFHPIASLTTQVPVLSCGGIGKRFLVPGWRLGWILVHDKKDRFGPTIRKGLQSLAQRLVGPNSIVQGALPTILKETPKEFFDNTIAAIKENANLACQIFDSIPGLKAIMPSGAMYVMVRVSIRNFPQFETDLQFVERLVAEQSVFCLPGQCFNYGSDGNYAYFRIVLTVPYELMREALNRIGDFCKLHYAYQNGNIEDSSELKDCNKENELIIN